MMVVPGLTGDGGRGPYFEDENVQVGGDLVANTDAVAEQIERGQDLWVQNNSLGCGPGNQSCHNTRCSVSRSHSKQHLQSPTQCGLTTCVAHDSTEWELTS